MVTMETMNLYEQRVNGQFAEFSQTVTGQLMTLKEQVEAIKEIADLLTKMRRAGDHLGLHIIDKELLDA